MKKKGWLEPLLDRIARNSTTVVCPVIDVIDEDSLAIHFDKKSVQVGGFDWGLQVKREKKTPSISKGRKRVVSAVVIGMTSD